MKGAKNAEHCAQIGMALLEDHELKSDDEAPACRLTACIFLRLLVLDACAELLGGHGEHLRDEVEKTSS